jgi:superfamily II DNA or RNA helicase/HKD family nuclease
MSYFNAGAREGGGGFKDLVFKELYDSNFTNVVKDFFVPALTQAKEYDRTTGFFTSSSLCVVADGLVEFIKNGGKMRILTSPRLSKEDANAIEEYVADRIVVDEIISSCMERELSLEEIKNDGVQALGWMLANGFLEIRLVLLTDEDGHVLDSAATDGMFHKKMGILRDGNNTVVFSGSINGTSAGLTRNIEEFNVFCDWKPGHESFISSHAANFERYWELGPDVRKLTVSLPDAVKNHWIRHVPAEFEELSICNNSKTAILRGYQQEAIDIWMSNGRRGIFNMATGTGKTLTATHAVKKLIESEKPIKLIIVVAVPLQHLAPQWEEAIKRTFAGTGRELNFISAYDNSSKWRPQLEEQVHHLKVGVINTIVVLTTYATLSSGKILEIIDNSKAKILLIGDEVHNAGAKKYSKGMSERFEYRLGLSATPARYFDDEGSRKILDYFGNIVFEFSIERAIKEKYLVPYNYYPLFVSLNSDELEEYGKFSEKITKLNNIKANRELTSEEEGRLELLLIQRSRVVKRADSKVKHFGKELPRWAEEGFIDHTVVYCSDGSDDDLKFTQQVITETNRMKIPTHQFTACETHVEREGILKQFDSGELKALIAIKCLDEGVDVPSTKTAIIMASTGNPREYVQRRGRVLRKNPGKAYADIFDYVVVPGEPSSIFREQEKSIFEKEYERFLEFSRYSLNRDENMRIISEKIEQLGIRSDAR